MAIHRKITLDSLPTHCVEEGECWLWQGYTTAGRVPYGYLHGKRTAVRRIVLLLRDGRALGPQQVASTTCGDPLCVRPDHIRVTTRSKQLARAWRDGTINNTLRVLRITATQRKGAKAKLSQETARAIRASSVPGTQLAPQLGVSVHLVNRVRAGKSWRELTGPWAGMGARK